MTLKEILKALSPEERAALRTESEQALGALNAQVERVTRIRDFQLGYGVVLATVLDQIAAKEQSESGVVSLVEKMRETTAQA